MTDLVPGRRDRDGATTVPDLHQAICFEVAATVSKSASTTGPPLPHAPDPPLHAARLGDRKRWFEPVTQVVSHQTAGRSCAVSVTHDKPVNIHMARKSRQTHVGCGAQNAPLCVATVAWSTYPRSTIGRFRRVKLGRCASLDVTARLSSSSSW
jgi:hypothetical protein